MKPGDATERLAPLGLPRALITHYLGVRPGGRMCGLVPQFVGINPP